MSKSLRCPLFDWNISDSEDTRITTNLYYSNTAFSIRKQVKIWSSQCNCLRVHFNNFKMNVNDQVTAKEFNVIILNLIEFLLGFIFKF